MTTNELIKILEPAISVDAGTIDLTDQLDNCGYWDSMSFIIFMAFVDQHLHLKLKGLEVQKCKTIQNLIDLCKSKLDD